MASIDEARAFEFGRAVGRQTLGNYPRAGTVAVEQQYEIEQTEWMRAG